MRWDGNIEQIVMRLAVDSEAADAAWIFPTPTVATVQLGHREWFTQIDDVTRPTVRVERDWWPRWKSFGYGVGAEAPGGGSVNLLDQQRLGPFVVATLDATNADALSAWLSTNGYRLSPELAQTLDGYVKQRWKYVAVKPATGARGALGDFLGDDKWLTEFETQILRPAAITADWEFTAAATDSRFRDVEVRREPVYILGIPGGWFIVGLVGTVLAVPILAGVVVAVIRRKPAARVSR